MELKIKRCVLVKHTKEERKRIKRIAKFYIELSKAKGLIK